MLMAEPLEFHLDDSGLEEFAEQGVSAVELALKYTATEAWGQVKREAPVDRNRLAGSFALSQRGPLEWVIASNVVYALVVHEGREPGPPPWKPVAKWAERKGLPPFPIWYGIKTRGTSPNRYADRAIEKTRQRTQEFVRRAIRETVGGADAAG